MQALQNVEAVTQCCAQLVERLRLQLVDARHADLQHAGNLGQLPITTPTIDEQRAILARVSAKWGELLRQSGLAGSQ